MALSPGDLDPNRFDLLTFDCYGTLVDWERGILEAVAPICAAHGASPAAAAVLGAFGRHEHVVQSERFRSYREALALTLDRMGADLGFRPTATQRRAFAASVGGWPVFPDTVDALRRLGRQYQLGIVSNVDDDLFAQSRERLEVSFDWVVTAQQVGSYKPASAHFHEMARRSSVPKSRTLHVAQSRFHDIAPASALGYATLWVDRPGAAPAAGAAPPAPAEADARVSSMAEAAALLAKSPVRGG